MILVITIDVDDSQTDPADSTGLTEAAYERLTGHTKDHGPGALTWLGEIQDVKKQED